MSEESVAKAATTVAHLDEHANAKGTLGPLLCWAVVFADIGTSVYYTPGILFQTVHGLAGFFVFLTMTVFVLLTLKYAEVTHRFPQGGGVVTVAAQALNPWFGALGGMFILVDYFLTAAISCLSGILYLSVVLPALGPQNTFLGLGISVWITIAILILLGLLNWIGIKESAKVSLVGAVIAFISDLAILFTIFTHLSLSQVLGLFGSMFASHALTPFSLLAGFAGSFLAFSGLESISQLSPVMRQPHKKIAGQALLLVVLTIGITSPLLTMFSTLLQPKAANDPVLNSQLVSLLAGHWGNIILQSEVAISASALLVFASNTAIIGAYHVFMALSRMEFLPGVILQRNRLRGTPHYSIALATVIPIIVLIAVAGNINLLGDMYAFGLLGAFTLTCLGLDIVRYRDKKKAYERWIEELATTALDSHNGYVAPSAANPNVLGIPEAIPSIDHGHTDQAGVRPEEARGFWFNVNFYLGILTTFLVAIAWSTNLVTKPLATAFGGGVTVLGLVIAYFNHARHRERGFVPVTVVTTHVEERQPNAILAVLSERNGRNEAVIQSAVHSADKDRPVVFLYYRPPQPRLTTPSMMEIVDPYLEDQEATKSFGKAEGLALKDNIPHRHYVYLQGGPDVVTQAWQVIHPHDMIIPSEENDMFSDINPDRIRYEVTPNGKVAHLLKNWK